MGIFDHQVMDKLDADIGYDVPSIFGDELADKADL
jgi:hypothetical protein